jgi:(R,R)-butanediol dehydrogenase/meso-butanediol dehydrogenase/diacetyl reductase
MKAIVYHNVNDLRYESDWPEPRPLKPGEVKVAIAWSGICGTDLEDLRKNAIIPLGTPHPESGRMAPLVIGHEYSGVVVETAPDVKNVKPRDRVAMECIRHCGHCVWCQRGEYASCLYQVSIGQHDDGGMAEFMVNNAYNCIKLSDSLPLDAASMAEPLAVMVRAVRKGRVAPGDVVTVVGAGAIGLFGIAMARVAGASKIIAITHGGHRAEVARLMGASHIINSRDEGWREGFMDLTDGHGSDVVIDCGGTAPAIRLAVELASRHGRIVLATVLNDDVPLNALDIMYNEKEIIGTVGHQHDREFKWAVQYMADGRVDPKPMITSRVYIEDAVEEGFELAIADRNQIKILVTPDKKYLQS